METVELNNQLLEIAYRIREMREISGYGSKGIMLWYSNVYNSKGSQSMTKHRIACDAFAEVLRDAGYECVVESRLD